MGGPEARIKMAQVQGPLFPNSGQCSYWTQELVTEGVWTNRHTYLASNDCLSFWFLEMGG